MATIKSYTDIEQSKRLEEILPIENADMWYWEWPTAPKYNNYEHPMFHKGDDIVNVPCWSLAALINILPRFIKFKGDKYYLRFMKEYVEYANDEVSITGRCLHTTGNDNLIDACYEMIIKLNELNLL